MQSAVRNKPPPQSSAGLAIQCAEAVTSTAQGLLKQRPTWAEFYREILGPDGAMRRLFTTAEELAEFKQTEAYGDLLAALGRLRAIDEKDYGPSEPQRIITLRIPRALHESLKEDAHDARTSMNQLCITRLLGLSAEQ